MLGLAMLGCGRDPLDQLVFSTPAPDASASTTQGMLPAPDAGGPLPDVAALDTEPPADTAPIVDTSPIADAPVAPDAAIAPDAPLAPDLQPARDAALAPDLAVPPDVAPDGADDPRLEARCVAPVVPVKPHLPVALGTLVSGAFAPAQYAWELVSAPAGSQVVIAVGNVRGFTFTPDRLGDYLLRFTVKDGHGRTAGCAVDLMVRVDPPAVSCAGGSPVLAGLDTKVSVAASSDDGPLGYAWTVAGGPTGALTALDPVDAPAAAFRADRGGHYDVGVIVTDRDGQQAGCRLDVHVLEAPRVTCPPDVASTVRNRPVLLGGSASDDQRVASIAWQVIDRPPGSSADPAPPDAAKTTFVPDRLGDYTIELTARDGDDLTARCQTKVHAVPEAPQLTCPPEMTKPLHDTPITATATDNGKIVHWAWKLEVAPLGSAVMPMLPDDSTFSFRPDLAGQYQFSLTITDDEGLGATCLLPVAAVADEGLRAEMFWDTDRTDLDLHVLSPTASHWFDDGGAVVDCYFQTCLNASPDWGVTGDRSDDPHLDLDAMNGFGPENINIDRPVPGIYRVGVHAVSGDATAVTVRLYCGGSRLDARATLGPVPLGAAQFWRVADVEVRADGSCQVTSLATVAGPNISSSNDARMQK